MRRPLRLVLLQETEDECTARDRAARAAIAEARRQAAADLCVAVTNMRRARDRARIAGEADFLARIDEHITAVIGTAEELSKEPI